MAGGTLLQETAENKNYKSTMKTIHATWIGLVLGLLVLIFPKVSLAACQMPVQISSSDYNISTGDKFIITATVEGIVPAVGCGRKTKPVLLVLFLLGNGGKDLKYGESSPGFKPEPGANEKFSFQWELDTSKLDKSVFYRDASGKISIKPKASLFADIGGASDDYRSVSESGRLEIALTGSSGSSSMLGLSGNVYFKPQKSYYNQGEQVQVLLNLTGSSREELKKSATNFKNLYISLLINGKSSGGFSRSIGDFINSDQFFDVEVGTAKGFQKGNNAITVELWEVKEGDGPKQKFLSATAQLQAFGDALPEPPAQGGVGNGTGGGAGGSGNYAGGGSENVTTNLSVSGSLRNPVKFESAGQLISGVISFLLGLIGALSALFIIIGGVIMITAAGRPEQLTKGKKTLTWAILGLAVSFLAYSLIAIVQNSL